MPFQRERELPDALTSGASAKAHRNLGWDFNYLKFLDEGHGSFSKQPESPSIGKSIFFLRGKTGVQTCSESFIEQAVVPMSIPDSWPTDRQLMSEIRMVSQTATLSAETAQAHMSEWSATGSGGDTQPLSEGGLIALLVLGSFLAGTIVVVAIQLLWRRRSGFKGTRHGGGPALPSTNFQMHASVLHEVITPSL
ncbi:hypothetical protein BC830DRAFT_953986 [Chytriomyces sp. MP71]|nr:hypothetical protein BC830DRAFT_953986 [Chytriomyces sp. MP71]